MERAKIIQTLNKYLSESRVAHCLRVEQIALQLAPHFGVAAELATPAALLHDLCREYSGDLLLKLAGNFGIVIDDIEKSEPLLLHGSVAAVLSRSDLGINDPEILEAITYHITGAPGVSSLTKLIYICDFIEPGRPYQTARTLREEAFSTNPEQLLLKVYNHTLRYLVHSGYLIHPRGVAARNELIMKGITE